MCGILGFVGRRDFSAEAFGAALDTMAARGPDDRGLLDEPEVLLGHRRLSIIDLSPAGHQPMASADRRYLIVFNGEVFNYRELRKPFEDGGTKFRSESDTEVVLELFSRKGPDCLSGLRGMFAFAIWDRQEKSLFLARDRMGIKPLYLWQTPERIAFASEVRALRALPGGPSELNPDALARYLAWGSVPGPETLLRGVVHLPAASWAVWKDGHLQTRSYWSFPGSPPRRENRAEALEVLGSTLREAVGLRCIADVPLGAFLSGGVDSSAVVALMRAAGQRDLRTFSISFPGSPLDEGPYALKVAEQFETHHTDAPITEADARAEIEPFFAVADQPTCDGVNTYLVSKFAKRGGLTVALSGLGGDELFAGYPHFRRGLRMLRGFGSLPSVAGKLAGSTGKLWGSKLAKLEAMGLAGSTPEKVYFTSRGLMMPSGIRRILTPEAWASARGGLETLAAPDPSIRGDALASPLHGLLAMEMRGYMQNQLLRDSDVFGMAHSLEIRVPLLDHIVVERVFSTSDTLLLADPPKGLLMDALPVPLPSECTHRPKMGFTFPFDSWMRGPWRGKMDEAFGGGAWSDGARRLLNPQGVVGVWESYLAGRVHWSRPWSLLSLLRWMR